jgi:RNase P/RNase MRP subunit p29
MKGKWSVLAPLLAVAILLGTVTAAQAAEVSPPPAEGRGRGVRGTVVAVAGNTLTVRTPREEVAVVVDADTIFRIPGVRDAEPDDVETGDLVGAAGEWTADGSLEARLIVVLRRPRRAGRLIGEVTAVQGTTLTISTRGGREVVLETDDETTFVVPGVADATLSDVHVGDRVVVQGHAQGEAPYARVVVVLPASPARLTGRISDVAGQTLVLETQGGTVRVVTEAGTLFQIPAVDDPTLADIREGDGVVCGGEWEDHTTFRALLVAVRRRSPAPGRTAVIRGRVTAVDGERLTLGTARGPLVVLVDEGTSIRVPGVEDPALTDIQVGDPVAARGQWNEDGTLQAQGILVLRRGG